MEPRIANDYAPQYSATPEEREHPRFPEYRDYQTALAQQLVTAPPFASWLRSKEEFEQGRSLVYEVTDPRAALRLGWYKNVFAPRAKYPETRGPFSSRDEAVAA